jgi:proliferating cell nuclear antigen
MFEMRMLAGRTFQLIIESIKELITDGNFQCSNEEMSIQCLDSSHVALVNLVLTQDNFEHYRCDKSCMLGVNMLNFSKVLKLMGKDDDLALRHDEKEDNLHLTFRDSYDDGVSEFGTVHAVLRLAWHACLLIDCPVWYFFISFTTDSFFTVYKLMDVDSEMIIVPEMVYSSVITLPSDEFQRIVRDLQSLGDVCTISTSCDGIKFSVAGDMGSGGILLKTVSGVDNRAGPVTVCVGDELELSFAMRYLFLFSKAAPLCGVVTLSMNHEKPMLVEYRIGNHGKLSFYLAPKMEDTPDSGTL